MKCHVDGELRPAERAVSAIDRGLLYGDAAVETLRAVDGSPFLWERHRERLENSCAALRIEPPANLRERVVTTLTANDLSAALVRVSVTRGTTASGGVALGDDVTGLTPPVDSEPTVLVTAEPTVSITEVGSEPATVQTVTTRPIPADSIPSGARSHCRLDRVLARRELVAGADEALMCTREGTVAGCAGSAPILVADDAIRVVPTSEDVVARPMRTLALELAREEGIPVTTGEFAPADVRDAQEVLLANARWGLRPVASVDGIEIGPGPVVALLRRLLADRASTA